MKSYKVDFLNLAIEDLRSIEDYYSAEFGMKSGKKLVGKIVKSVRKLKQFPFVGTPIRDKELSSQGYRTIFCDDFVIIYRVVEDVVYIYHIANTQTEYALFFK